MKKSITYKGKTYKSYKDLYCSLREKNPVAYSAFIVRIKKGQDPKEAIKHKSPHTWRITPITFNGVSYPSIKRFYDSLRREHRKTCHRKLSVRYERFSEIVRKKGIEEAVKRAKSENTWSMGRDLKRESRRLQGADNLVCQRMTKLGWSYERAISTPRNTRHLPKKVVYKGKTYKSITACWKDVKPGMSMLTFKNKVLIPKHCIK